MSEEQADRHSKRGYSSGRAGKGSGLLAAILLVAGIVAPGQSARAAEEAREIPAPAVAEATPAPKSAVAVLAGGCFWGIQGVFQRVEGVTSAVSGYAGGDVSSANYDEVSTGRTRHAEAVRITYDPARISYGRLLQIFFSVGHDPTQLNRQGPDVGPQYRSAVFPRNTEQSRIAAEYIAQLDKTRVFGGRIVTTIEPNQAFHPAEDYHQDYLTRHPGQPYIVINDMPKIDNLKRLFPALHRREPVLVQAAR